MTPPTYGCLLWVTQICGFRAIFFVLSIMICNWYKTLELQAAQTAMPFLAHHVLDMWRDIKICPKALPICPQSFLLSPERVSSTREQQACWWGHGVHDHNLPSWKQNWQKQTTASLTCSYGPRFLTKGFHLPYFCEETLNNSLSFSSSNSDQSLQLWSSSSGCAWWGVQGV